MVYDRGRAVRDPHDGAHFGSSGSPRSRYAADTANYAQKPGPTRPHAVPSSDAFLADDSLPSIKKLVDMVSERVFWYIQRDAADKKCKKLRQDVKRCYNGDFSSAGDMLDVHSKAADLEKAKVSQRMTAVDDMLVQATSAWWSKLDNAAQSINANARHDLTPPPSETASDINLSIEEKLGHMRENLEASMRNQIAEEVRKLQSATKDADESRTAILQTHTMRESQKLAQLRDGLEASLRNRMTEESRKLQSEVKDADESRTTTLQSHTMRESQKLAQLRDGLEASLRNRMTEESRKLQSDVKDAYESRTATIQTHAMQESQKLTQMRSNLETVIRKQSAEESQKLQSNIKDQHEAQIAALNQTIVREKEVLKSLQDNLSHEKEVSKSLQAELKSTNARLAALEAKVEDQAKNPAQPDRTIKQEVFVDLESRLARIEASQMATNKSKDEEAIEKQKTDMSIDSVRTQRMDASTAQSLYLELGAELQDKLTQFLLQSGDRIVPDKRVQRLVQPNISAMERHVQSELKRISGGFGKIIDKEREMRASLGLQVEAAAQSASASAQAVEDMRAERASLAVKVDAAAQSASASIQAFEDLKGERLSLALEVEAAAQSASASAQAVANMRAELSAVRTTSDANRQSDAATVKKQQDQIQDLTTSLASTSREIEVAKSGLQKSVDALLLQTANLHAWQQNFSTPELYQAIVEHLNYYFMPDHLSSLGQLKARVTNIEGRLRLGDDGNKKRKLSDQPFPSPSLPGR